MDFYRIYSVLSDTLRIEPESLFNVFECIVLIWLLVFARGLAGHVTEVGAPDGTRENWTIWTGRKWEWLWRAVGILVVVRLLLHVVLLSYNWVHYYVDPEQIGAAVTSFLLTLLVYAFFLAMASLMGDYAALAFPVVAVAAFFVQGFFLYASDKESAVNVLYILLPFACLMEALILTCTSIVSSELREKTQKYYELAPQYDHYVVNSLTPDGNALLVRAMIFLDHARKAQNEHPDQNVILRIPTMGPGMVERTNEAYRNELAKAIEYRRGGINAQGCGAAYMVSDQKFVYQGPFDYAGAVPPIFRALNWNREPTKDEYHDLCRAISTYAYAIDALLNEEYQKMAEALTREWEIIDRGYRGEQIALDAAKQLTRSHPSIRILENYRIETERGSAECDLVLITPVGIVCIEVKNYGEDGVYTLLIQNDGSWYKNYGSQVHAIDGNPFAQNAGHAAALRAVFGDELRAVGAKILPLVMVPNDVMVENLSPYEVIHSDALAAWMSRQPEVLSADQIDRIWMQMKKHALPPLAFKHVNFLGWQELTDYHEAELQCLCELLPQLRPSEKYRIS